MVPHDSSTTGQEGDASTDTVSGAVEPTPSVSRKGFLGTAAKVAAGAAALSAGVGSVPALAADGRHLPEIMRKGSQVTLTYFYGANPGEEKLRQQLFSQFEAANPDIKLVSQLAGTAGLTKLNTEIAGGTTPDLMMGWELTYGAYARRGVFMDLKQFINHDSQFQDTVMSQEYPAVLDMFSSAGHLWVLPEQVTNVVLFYNKDHVQAAGLTMPTSWDDPTWTWDKFLSYAQKLTQTRGNRITRYGFSDMWWWPITATNVIALSNGGAWFKQPVEPAAGSSNLSDPRIVQAIQWYADLAWPMSTRSPRRTARR